MLAVIAVLAGASFLGGGLALGEMMTGRVAAGDEPGPSEEPGEEPSEEEAPAPDPTEEPTPTEDPYPTEEPTEEPEVLLTAEELVIELRRDYSIGSRLDTTADICAAGDEEEVDLFRCTSAMDTDMVRVIAFESSGIASLVVMAMEESGDSEAQDIQEACHFVLVWFEENGMDGGERDTMADSTREIAGCP